jgi:hypothetical protein
MCASFNIVFEEYKNAGHENQWPWIWRCNDCKAFVGCHNQTRIPMGRIADANTRRLRAHAHIAFDPIWHEFKLLSRVKAYNWLARQMSIESSECHFAWMTAEQLQKAIELSKIYILENSHKADKRQAKRHEQKRRTIQFERDAINRRKGGTKTRRSR